MDYDKMFDYVFKMLNENNALYSKRFPFRNRFEHIKRVFNWCIKIKDDIKCDEEVLLTAAIFHDVGYCYGKDNHANASAKLFIDYATKCEFEYEFIMKTADIISLHSNKELLQKQNIYDELILLLEADLLDEEGALGICWDVMQAALEPQANYTKCLQALDQHSAHILNQDFMVTPLAKKYWQEKQEIFTTFRDSLKADLFIE